MELDQQPSRLPTFDLTTRVEKFVQNYELQEGDSKDRELLLQLIKMMSREDFKKRITVEKALEHEFFKTDYVTAADFRAAKRGDKRTRTPSNSRSAPPIPSRPKRRRQSDPIVRKAQNGTLNELTVGELRTFCKSNRIVMRAI